MKLAWLCYPYEDDPSIIEIQFSEPREYKYWKVEPIVYALIAV